jgi:3-oxoadipate enol-lactonase
VSPLPVHDVHGRAGDPVLVLAPSIGTHRETWAPQLAAFAQAFHVVRIEHRGHDASDVPPGPYSLDVLGRDVLSLLDGLAVERFSFCGLSLGAMVGMWLAAHAGSRVERLALCCTSAYLPPAQGWLDRAAAVRAGGTAAVADAVVSRWFTPDFAVSSPDLVRAAREMLLTTPAEGYAGCCEAIAAMDLRPLLGRITAPTIVVAGADDLATPLEHAYAVADGIATASPVVVIPGAAHLATLERPDACTEVLLAHLEAKQ